VNRTVETNAKETQVQQTTQSPKRPVLCRVGRYTLLTPFGVNKKTLIGHRRQGPLREKLTSLS